MLARAKWMRSNPTEAEARLWSILRAKRLSGLKWRHQVVFDDLYIADFVCLDAKLIIEIDGSQHGESDYDRVRDTELKSRGFRVLRFWNDDVLRDLDAVCDTIIAYVRDRSLQPWR